MTNSRIWLSPPHMCGREKEYIQDAFNKNWITTVGENITGLENDTASYLGENHAGVVLNSGTAAIHLALILLNVKQGDFVICQDLTFAASVNPIAYLGGIPVLVDSENETWNLSPYYLEKAIQECIHKGKKPKVIIWVNLYGMPAQINEIKQIAEKYDIALLEDAAESLGSSYKERKCGTFGDISIISFNGNKIVTTSGGGILLSQNREYIEKAKFLSTQARDNAPHYQHSEIGYNYRMSNICAGIGRGQMTVLPERIEQRRRNNEYYRKHLSDVKGISFQTEPSSDYYSNYWLTSILVDPKKTNGVTREDIRLALDAANIESRPLWKPMHLQPVFSNCPFYGDGTGEKLFNQGLCLPSGSKLTDKELERVVDVIKSQI